MQNIPPLALVVEHVGEDGGDLLLCGAGVAHQLGHVGAAAVCGFCGWVQCSAEEIECMNGCSGVE